MMSKIQVLDCTLRDGGYCNNCRFGFDNERKIVHGLVEANIDIIECGFLMNTVEYDKDVTKFTSLDEVAKIQEDGRTKRREAEAELGRIEGELKQKLLEVRK